MLSLIKNESWGFKGSDTIVVPTINYMTTPCEVHQTLQTLTHNDLSLASSWQWLWYCSLEFPVGKAITTPLYLTTHTLMHCETIY